MACSLAAPRSLFFGQIYCSELPLLIVIIWQVAWAPGSEWEVATGMLDIFHKLPPQAKKFLETHGESLASVVSFVLVYPRLRNTHRYELLEVSHAGERPGIVVLTIGLEESLPKLPGSVIPSKLWSPYRLPLIRFLNQYPSERRVPLHVSLVCGCTQTTRSF